MKRTNVFAAACLVAGLGIAWANNAPAAVADQLTLNVTPTVNLTDAYFLYGSFSESGPNFSYSTSATFLGNLTGGVDNSINFVAPTPGGNAVNIRGTLIGIYDTGNGLITLGFQSYNAGLLTATPTSFANSLLTSYTEAGLATAMQTGDTTTLASFYANDRVMLVAGIPVGEPGGLINFSLSSYGGSFSLSATPEPGTAALLGLGLFGFACFRRTRPAGR